MSEIFNNEIGAELADAAARLEFRGFVVRAVEVRSKKGVGGGVPRVIRQRCIGENTIELCYSYMICTPRQRQEEV